MMDGQMRENQGAPRHGRPPKEVTHGTRGVRVTHSGGSGERVAAELLERRAAFLVE